MNGWTPRVVVTLFIRLFGLVITAVEVKRTASFLIDWAAHMTLMLRTGTRLPRIWEMGNVWIGIATSAVVVGFGCYLLFGGRWLTGIILRGLGAADCPSCGYDMSAAAGQHCPECGDSSTPTRRDDARDSANDA